MIASEQSEARQSERPEQGSRVSLFLASGCYFGYSPVASGTVGALWGIPLAILIGQIPWLGLQIATIVGICVVGIPLCTSAAKRLGVKDPGTIVWDEIASLPMTFFLVPVEHIWNPVILAGGFVLNRVFDIVKPPPARRLERLPGGLGIMADDWVAGVYSCIVIHLLLRIGLVG